MGHYEGSLLGFFELIFDAVRCKEHDGLGDWDNRGAENKNSGRLFGLVERIRTLTLRVALP